MAYGPSGKYVTDSRDERLDTKYTCKLCIKFIKLFPSYILLLCVRATEIKAKETPGV